MNNPLFLLCIIIMYFTNVQTVLIKVHHEHYSSVLYLVSSQHWLTELEVMASLFAAAIHDYEHTGTTNNFHIHTK